MLHVKNFTRRVRKVHFWHFPTKSRYRQKTCWVNSFQCPIQTYAHRLSSWGQRKLFYLYDVLNGLYRNYKSIPFHLCRSSHFLKHSSLTDRIEDLTLIRTSKGKCVLSIIGYLRGTNLGKVAHTCTNERRRRSLVRQRCCLGKCSRQFQQQRDLGGRLIALFFFRVPIYWTHHGQFHKVS